MINWNEFHFVRPEALILLIAVPLVAWLLYRQRSGGQEWSKVCDPELLPYVVEQQSSGKSSRNWLWPLLLGIPTIIALAGPAWERVPQPVFDETQALIVLLDSSRSMDAEDVKPSRYERAKLKVLDLLNERNTGQTALIAYAAEPFVVSPLTNDSKTIAALVSPLKTGFMPRQGSNAALAVAKAVELLNNAGARGNILLISDGVKSKNIAAAVAAANSANASISVIGIGSTDGAPIPSRQGFVKDAAGNIVVVKQDVRQLKQLASETGGSYSQLSADNSDLERTAQTRRIDNANSLQSTEFKADQWREQGPWLLLPLLLIAPLLFRRGVLMVGFMVPFTLSLASYSPSAESTEAWEWRDLFRNQDQRAAARFDHGQFEQSAEQFKSPEWKASAQYRAGDYEGAVKTLESIDNKEANYNRGNALAKMGKIKEAISAYKEVLLADKDHEDARHNLELLENQQQEQNQDRDQSDSSEQQDSDQQSQDQQQREQQNSEQEQSEQNQSESQQSESQDSQSEQESEEQQGEEQQSQTESSEEENQEAEDNYQQQYQDKTEQEIEQATQQWLRRIPDQPGNLLRNQFENEYRRRQKQGGTNSEDQPW